MISHYGQAALLLHSVKDRVAGPYLDALEDLGVPVRHVAAGSADGAGAGGSPDQVLVTTIHQAKGQGMARGGGGRFGPPGAAR